MLPPLSSFQIASTKRKRDCIYLAFGITTIVVLTILNLTSLWVENKMMVQLSASEMNQQVLDIINLSVKWSDIKLAIYMTTHLSESQLLYLPCWNDAIQRMELFKYADLILYTSSQPTPEQLALLPFRNTTIKLFENKGYQEGAVQAMLDPFMDNATWFDEYDWIIRLNPDVLIRHDAWLIETMMNTSIDGIFHDCLNRKTYTCCTTDFHTDFYAFRPSAVNRSLIWTATRRAAEPHMSESFRNIFDSGRFSFVEGGLNAQAGLCRIEGPESPVIHSHDLWTACPYYYNATKEGYY
jgi:hypothetical protein